MEGKSKGTIYLLHFTKPFKHAAHYLGFTPRKIEKRIGDHVSGNGSKLTSVASAAGIEFILARTWKGGRNEERRLKRQGGASRLCPICKAEKQTAKGALLRGGRLKIGIVVHLREKPFEKSLKK